MIVSTVIINIYLVKSRKNLETKQPSSDCDPVARRASLYMEPSQAPNIQVKDDRQMAGSSTTHGNQRNLPRFSSKREQKDRSFSLTSMAINAIFFIMNIGVVIMNLLDSYYLLDRNQYMLFSGVSVFLFFTDFSIKFFIYLAVNPKKLIKWLL